MKKKRMVSQGISILRRIGLLRWEITALIMAGLILFFMQWAALPFLRTHVSLFKKIKHSQVLYQQMNNFDSQILSYSLQAKILDSLIKNSYDFSAYRESHFLQSLYSCADSVHLNLTKVQIGLESQSPFGRQIPILFEAQGSYGAMGRFISFLENCVYAIRIQQCTIQKKGNDSGFIECTFSVIDQNIQFNNQ